MKFTSLITRWAPTAAAAALVLGNVASAQCPTDDDAATNDDCASAAPIASGLTSGLVATDVSEDWYTITVADGDSLNVDITFDGTVADLDARLEGPCGTFADSSGTSGSLENLAATNSSGGAIDYKIRAFLFSGTCVDYSVDITVTTPPTCVDDDAATNDDCASAAPIASGLTSGLAVTDVSEDWYTITVADGDNINVDITFDGTVADLDARLEGPCGTFADSSGTSGSLENLSATNSSGGALDYKIRAFLFSGSCVDYSIDITVTTPPMCADDAFEPNDDCGTPAPITPGLYTGLNMDAGLRDYYSITLANGDQIEVNATFIDADGDIDFALYDAGGCDLFGSQVASSTSSTDNESLSYTNLTGSAQALILRGRRFGTQFCTPYDLEILVSTPPACIDDDMGTNDICADADALGTGSTLATVTDISDDFYVITVPDGDTVIIDALFVTADGDIDIELDDDATCTSEVDSGETVSDNEQVQYSNTTGADVDVTLRVLLFSGVCNNYELDVTLAETACLGADDAEEENDTCLTASVPSANPLMGLFVSKSDMDYYGPFTLADMEEIDVLVAHIQADGDIDARIFDAADCTTILDSGTSVSDDEVLEYVNMTGASQDVIVQVELWSGDSSTDCNNYDLDVAISPFMDPCAVADDSFEDNDDCTTAAPITEGSYTGLFGQKASIDSDWYSIMVADGATLNVDVLHIQDNGDFDVTFSLDCVSAPVAGGAGVADIESVSWMNSTGMAQTVRIHVFIWSGDSNSDCNDYDMDIGIIAPDFSPFCFGDGSGTACPCMNDAAMGSGGGCLNADGGSAVLAGSGTTSEMANDIMFNVSDAAQLSFALLVSADNRLGGGSGILGMPASDGLRCVGGNLLRHGTRATDLNGDNLNPWGTGVGIVAQSGFVAGQTRHFQVRYRDTAGPCATGTNTSQGLSVTFTM